MSAPLFGSDPGASRAPVAAWRTMAARREAARGRDLMLPDDARLDERSRATARGALEGAVLSVAARLTEHANVPPDLLERVLASGVLDGTGLADRLAASSAMARLSDAILNGAEEQPTLLPRLTECPDPAVADAAAAVLADAAAGRGGAPALDADEQAALAWAVAAALIGEDATANTAALAKAAQAVTQDAQPALDAPARLAAAIAPRGDEIGPLLVEAVRDGQLSTAAAMLAQELAVEAAIVREMLIDARGDMLVLALRAAGLDRGEVGRIGATLLAADPARDGGALADALDRVAALPVKVAREALAPLTLPAALHAHLDRRAW